MKGRNIKPYVLFSILLVFSIVFIATFGIDFLNSPTFSVITQPQFVYSNSIIGDFFAGTLGYTGDSYYYYFKNIENNDIRDITTSITFPNGTIVIDSGSASVEGSMITWPISLLTPNEERTFVFGAEPFYGSVLFETTGTLYYEEEKEVNIIKSVDSGQRKYERITLIGEGYLTSIEFDIEVDEHSSGGSDVISDPGPSGSSGKASRATPGITGAVISEVDILEIYIDIDDEWNGNEELLSGTGFGIETIMKNLEEGRYSDKFYIVFDSEVDAEIEIESIKFTREFDVIESNEIFITDEMIEDGTFSFSNIFIEDADGNVLNSQIKILDSETKSTLSNFDIMEKDLAGVVVEGYYNVELILEEGPIEKIVFDDVYLGGNDSVRFKIDDPIDNEGFIELYAIDPTLVNFASAEVTVTAKSNKLHKCKEWDFENRICNGEWEFLKSITPGEEYTFELTPEDPGFAEEGTHCYAVHNVYENIANYGMARTFDNVSFAISDSGNALKSEYKWKSGGSGYETPPVNTSWNVFNDKQDANGYESYFFTDVYTNDTIISGTVFVSAESKDKNGDGEFNWTLYEYDPSNGSYLYNFGSQVWDGTGADDPVDSNLSISNHTITAGNRLLLKVVGKLDAVPISGNGELKFKVDEVGAETSTTVTSTYCSNVHNTYKSFLVLVLTEEFIPVSSVTTNVSFYSLGDAVGITGSTWDAGADVTLYVYNTTSDIQTGYPKNVTVNSTGHIIDEFTLSINADFGNWTINATQVNDTSKNDSIIFEVSDDLYSYPPGTLIIPMDSKQNADSSSADFLRAYGMVWRYANNSIHVEIAITPPCYRLDAYDVDTSVNYSEDYCNGFFVIDDVNAWSYLTTLRTLDIGGIYPFENVTVHNVTSGFNMKEEDIFFLQRAPRTAILSGSEDEIITTVDPSYIPYDILTETQVKDGTLNATSYDILAVGHYKFTDSVLADAIKNYTIVGGNIHAECIATRSLDSYTGFVGNVVSDGGVSGDIRVFNADDLKMQTHVSAFDNEGGNTPTLDVTNALRNYTIEAVDDNYDIDNNYVKLISAHYGKGYITYAGGHLGDVTGGLEVPRNRILDNIIFFAVETNDLTFPTWFNQNQSKDFASSNDQVYVWSNWHDNTALNVSTLSHNASGSWVNVSIQNLSGKSDLSNFSISTLGFSDGTLVSWRIFANDSSGNDNVTDIMSFTIDADSPDITIQSPTNSTYSNPLIWFNATTDQTSDWCGYSLNGNSNVTMNNISTTNWYYSDSNVTDGFYNVTVYCNDTADNMNSSIEYFSVLTSGPNLTISNPKNEIYNIKLLNLTVVNDSTSQYCWYSLNAGVNITYTCENDVPITAVEGLNNVSVYSNNTYGTESTDFVYFTVDTSQVLDITITSPVNDTYINDVTPELTLLAVDYDYVTINYTLYIYYANGTLYNIANSGTLTNNTPSVMELSENLVLLSNATTYYIVAVSNDSAPNFSNSSNLYVTLTDPTLDLESPENNYYDNDGDINFTFHYHSMSFVTMNCSLYLNGVFNQSNISTVNDAETTFVVTGINEGNNQNWTVHCENSTAYGEVSRIFNVDNTEPTIGFVNPTTTNGNHSQNYIEVNVSANDLNLDTIIVYLYNSTHFIDSVSNTSSFYNNIIGLPDGVYYLNSSANDTAGNWNSTGTNTITLDTIAPVISFISPANTTYITSNVMINVSITDVTTDVSYAVAEVNGTENITLVRNGDYWYNSTYNFSDGLNTVKIYTNDSLDNWDTSQEIFTVNTGLFLENITTSPSLPTTKDNSSENISVNLGSSKYPINVTFILYNSTGHLVHSQGPIQLNNASMLPTNYTIPAGLPDGTYSLNMTSNDSVGNNQTDFLGNFTIDSIPPIIQNVNTNPEIIYETGTTIINVTAIDQLSFVDEVIIEIEYPNSTKINYTMSDIGLDLWEYGFNDTTQIGNYTYYIYANDTVGNVNSDGPYQFTVLTELSPFYSGEIQSPSSPATYVIGAVYEFNITWIDLATNVDEIIFEFDGVNESYLDGDIDRDGDVYYITRSNLTVGTYNYTWYANDTADNWNSTGVLTYVINADVLGPIIEDIVIIPDPVEPGDNTTITANVTDVSGVDVVLINITWDSTFELIEMTYNNTIGLYEVSFTNTTLEDIYNITIIANDTIGNIANTTGDFVVEEVVTPPSGGPKFLPPPETTIIDSTTPVSPTTPTITTPEITEDEQQLIESLSSLRRDLDSARLRLTDCTGINIILLMILLIPIAYLYGIGKRLRIINEEMTRFETGTRRK
ncbi:MAG: hypothetical protein GOV02_02325 [Candidatus Aenigmarchaeota archaeon]|nr:hypothetical protein [Candidatus Aenigmarchaeota archaeon]